MKIFLVINFFIVYRLHTTQYTLQIEYLAMRDISPEVVFELTSVNNARDKLSGETKRYLQPQA